MFINRAEKKKKTKCTIKLAYLNLSSLSRSLLFFYKKTHLHELRFERVFLREEG